MSRNWKVKKEASLDW